MPDGLTALRVGMSHMQKIIIMMLLLFACAYSAIVTAQESNRSETVIERSRPKLDARGIPVGATRLFPTVDFELLHDDNIYADNALEVDDLITVITPKLVLEAEWSRAELDLGTDLVVGRYSDIGTEDYEDWRIWGDLGVDLGRGQLLAKARHEDLHEDRTSPDDSRGIKPTEFTVDAFVLGYRNRFGRFDVRPEFSHRSMAYDDTATLDGPENNEDRDRTRSDLSLRVGYGQSQRFQPFAKIRLTQLDYDQSFDRDGFQRSSDGYDIVGGTGIDLTGQAFGEVFVGYIRRDYDDQRFRKVDGPIFGGDLTWNISGLTTLQLSASRLIKSTTIVGAAGITDTGLGLEVDHELLRNLILSFNISANNEDFEGVDRSDDIFRAGLEGTYMMNRTLHFRFGINFLQRDTSPQDSGGLEYDIRRIFIAIQGQI